MALTFDDGPHPESTPQVLDILADSDVRATFFCVGYRSLQYPELVHRMVAEGHAVGSHSQTHRVGGLPAHEVFADYQMGRRSVEEVLQRPVPLFRPPHGIFEWKNTLRLRRARFRSWIWTVDAQDYVPGTDTEFIRRTVAASTPDDVVLMHDGLEEALDGSPPRAVMIEALADAIAALQARGLRPVVL